MPSWRKFVESKLNIKTIFCLFLSDDYCIILQSDSVKAVLKSKLATFWHILDFLFVRKSIGISAAVIQRLLNGISPPPPNYSIKAQDFSENTLSCHFYLISTLDSLASVVMRQESLITQHAIHLSKYKIIIIINVLWKAFQ